MRLPGAAFLYRVVLAPDRSAQAAIHFEAKTSIRLATTSGCSCTTQCVAPGRRAA
jgi:hypothetical protein